MLDDSCGATPFSELWAIVGRIINNGETQTKSVARVRALTEDSQLFFIFLYKKTPHKIFSYILLYQLNIIFFTHILFFFSLPYIN
jgi:hypothetical protein